MSVIKSIESGVLPAELTEALRTLLSQRDQPYLDIPGIDGPGICVSTSLADFRRHVETEYQEKLDSRPKVPASYSVGGRRKLPDNKPKYRDVAAQTEPMHETVTYMATQTKRRPGTPTGTAQVESAPEPGRCRRKGVRRPIALRIICSSSSDTDRVANAKSPRQSGQGWYPSLYVLLLY
jgi:hypothetical protein